MNIIFCGEEFIPSTYRIWVRVNFNITPVHMQGGSLMINLSNEITINIINEVVKIVPYLNVDIQKQVELRNKIEEQLNDYEITSKCTELSTCDILEKAFMYLACKKLEGMADSTRYNYILLFKKMASFFRKPVASISTMDLRLFIAKVYTDNQPNSKNTKISSIKAFYGWLQDEGYIIANPSKNLMEVKVPHHSRGHLKQIDIEKMRDKCKTVRDKLLIDFLLTSGARVSEISNALISNVNWNENSISIIGKGNKERVVYFSTRTRYYIEEYIKQREAKGVYSDYLFVASKIPYANLGSRSIERDVKRIAIDAEITYNVYPHIFRRSYSTIAIEQGVKVTSLQCLLGHSSLSTTQRYYDLNDANVKHEYKKIAL